MDIATLSLVHAILDERGIRRAAKAGNRPAASVSAALKRFEAAIAVPLVRREGGSLVPTLEAQSRMADLAAAQSGIQLLLSLGAAGTDAVPSIALTALDRFVTVARSGSIRSAAKITGAGQPQLTRQMADLERDLGCDLLIRSPSGIACTPEGLAAIPIVENLLEIWRRLSRASGDRFRRTAATWRFGSVMPLGPESEIARMLAALTAEWHRARPRQPLFISSTTADELIAGLKNRRFDVVLLDLEAFPTEFEGRLISRTPLALAGHGSLFAAHDKDLRSLLQSNPIAVPSLKSGLRQQAERFISETLGEQERNRLTVTEVDSIPVILNLVTNHGYLSVLPESSAARVRNAPAMLRLGPGYMQSLSLAWQKNALSRQAGEAMLAMMSAPSPDSDPSNPAPIP
ncbi:LysR family transcriptional regulator [Pararhizobium sp. BT-229]|uniref:LysR family transcriptional regulator n=1 Tax=Pararhizobium sp. BT-229 TaxID=2986923 RepID=UPI0021F7D37C|nr:LysR family transcriptional regulator [Pararhizobium sp. BT-229]MCV9961086.1 LysR family transcriptional regulator [Pararhizobium sp. BT-229]